MTVATMAGTSTAHAAYARESSGNEDDNDIQVRRFRIMKILIADVLQDQLFSFLNEQPAIFLFHNFENADKYALCQARISLILSQTLGLDVLRQEHGGRLAYDDNDADVILTISREEYIFLKDKYAISRKTHVHLSGFVDRCINARRFQLAPIVPERVRGRKIMSR